MQVYKTKPYTLTVLQEGVVQTESTQETVSGKLHLYVSSIGGSTQQIKGGERFTKLKIESLIKATLLRLFNGDINSISLFFESSDRNSLAKGYWTRLLLLKFNISTKELTIMPTLDVDGHTDNRDYFSVNLETKDYHGNLDLYKIVDAILVSDANIFEAYKKSAVDKRYYILQEYPFYNELLDLGAEVKINKNVTPATIHDFFAGCELAVNYLQDIFPEFFATRGLARLSLCITEKSQHAIAGAFFSGDYAIRVLGNESTNKNNQMNPNRATRYVNLIAHEFMHYIDYAYFPYSNNRVTRLIPMLRQTSNDNYETLYKSMVHLIKRTSTNTRRYSAKNLTYYTKIDEIMCRALERVISEDLQISTTFLSVGEAVAKGVNVPYPTEDLMELARACIYEMEETAQVEYAV